MIESSQNIREALMKLHNSFICSLSLALPPFSLSSSLSVVQSSQNTCDCVRDVVGCSAFPSHCYHSIEKLSSMEVEGSFHVEKIRRTNNAQILQSTILRSFFAFCSHCTHFHSQYRIKDTNKPNIKTFTDWLTINDCRMKRERARENG